MLSIEYYRKIKQLYRTQVSKAEFIYIYTHNCCVDHVMFKSRKGKYEDVNEVPHDKLLLSRDKKLPADVIVQVKFSPLRFDLFEG